MIARISGILIHKSVNHVVVDTQGLGYRVFVPLTTFYDLPDIGQPVTLNIHTHVREDAIHLFGFYTLEDKSIFQLLISVSGIGPKLAMNILSGISAPELIKAIIQGHLNRLVAIPGVGKKMAERMILELKDKALKISQEEGLPDHAAPLEQGEAMKEDAMSALVNLGYKSAMSKDVIARVIHEAPESLTLDILLKKALKILSG